MSKNSTAQKIEQPTQTMKVLTPAIAEVVKEQPKAPEATAETKPEPKPLTLAEIKRKNEVLSRLMERHEILSEKRRRVENFRLSHDRDTATVLVTDANGEEFQSNSPKTIGRLIEFWMNEFNEALSELEKEIRETA